MIFLLLVLMGCSSPKENITHFRSSAMTIPYHVQVAGNLSIKEEQKIEKIIEEHFAKVNRVYNHWNDNSELSKLNQMDSSEALLLSSELLELIELSQKIYTLSSHRFDPSRGGAISALKRGIIEKKPSESSFEALSIKSGVATKSKEPLQLDLDALSKGYAIDELVALLEKEGYKNVYVEWGGDIKAIGKPSELRNWTVLIRNPSSPYPEDAIERLEIIDEALATSGDYIQRYGEEYSHFVDGQTGLPRKVTNIASVTVRAKSCAMADACATVAMLFDTKEEIDLWIEKIKPAEVWVTYRE